MRLEAGDDGLWDGSFYPSLSLAYARELLDEDAFAAAFASDPSSGFMVEGAEFGKDRLLVGAGATFLLSARSQLAIAYDGDLSNQDRSHAGTARLQFAF